MSLVLPISALATDYYIDYDSGADNNNGTSAKTAWKHHPDDPNASDTADATSFSPGDTVYFKGGVVYKGRFSCVDDGESGKPITLDGTGETWGSSAAIIDGGTEISGWMQCPDAATCGDNPNYINIYYKKSTGYSDFQQGFLEDGVFIFPAADPKPDDPFFWKSVGAGTYGNTIADPDRNQTTITITDTGYFTQTSSDYWDGAYAVVWRSPNLCDVVEVTSLNTLTDTITHDALGGSVYSGRTTYYSVVNHLSLLDRAGEFVLDEDNETLYIWPTDSADPTTHTYTACSSNIGIHISGADRYYITIKGFKIRAHGEGIRQDDIGSGDNIILQDNTLQYLNGSYAMQVSGSNMTITGNTIEYLQGGCKGIYAYVATGVIDGNTITKPTSTGIYAVGSTVLEITDNVINTVQGTHGNGIAAYSAGGNQNDVLIARNKVWDSPSALTFERSSAEERSENITIFANYFDGDVNEWGYGTTDIQFINNTVNSTVSFDVDSTFVVSINNILHNGNGNTDTHTYNIYVGDPDNSNALLDWQNAKTDEWGFCAGEIYTNNGGVYSGVGIATVLNDYNSNDFTLVGSCDAIDNGTDPISNLPTDTFVSIDFSKDIDAKSRPQNGTWDIGAHEYMVQTTKP